MGRGIGVVLMLLTVLPAASACFWPTASLPPLCLSRHPPATPLAVHSGRSSAMVASMVAQIPITGSSVQLAASQMSAPSS